VVRLGRSTLLKIVLQQKVGEQFAGAGAAYGLQRGALWRSALGGAIAAELLARREGSVPPDLAFLCGLLRDIGKLAFDARFGESYFEKVRASCRSGITYDAAEQACFGFDHAQLGGELATRWGLPARIAGAIAHHHAPPASAPEHDALYDVVHAADIVCMWAGLAIGNDGLQYEFAPHARQGLNIDLPFAQVLIVDVWSKLREVEDLMSANVHATEARTL
jgi:putative nucleotidyltransferase with HDIG domain